VTFRFWGVRGSLPCPASPAEVKAKISTVVHRIRSEDLASPESRERFLAQLPPEVFGLAGGNTTCLEVEADNGHALFADGGTGLRWAGMEQRLAPCHYHILLTHFHWDHLQGIPFFAPLSNPAAQVTFYSPVPDFEAVVRAQMEPPYFPVTLASFPARVRFVELGTGPFLVAGTEVRWKTVNHPGSCVSYRFTRRESALVFSTDHELRLEDFHPSPEATDFFTGADVLVLDSQYTPGEAVHRADWGHSSSGLAVDFALDFGARRLYLFHHEPDHGDSQLEEIGRTAQWYADHKRPGALTVRIAREGTKENSR